MKERQQIIQKEKETTNQIKFAENAQKSENNAREKEKVVLEKDIFFIAKEKLKKGEQSQKEEDIKKVEEDYLEPILLQKNKKLEDIIDKNGYDDLRRSAFDLLKNRMLQRSDIIHKRLEKESAELERKFQDLQSKGDHVKDEEEAKYEKDFTETSFKIDILTERASLHYTKALKKFHELDEKLRKDPRFAKFQQPN